MRSGDTSSAAIGMPVLWTVLLDDKGLHEAVSVSNRQQNDANQFIEWDCLPGATSDARLEAGPGSFIAPSLCTRRTRSIQKRLGKSNYGTGCTIAVSLRWQRRCRRWWRGEIVVAQGL